MWEEDDLDLDLDENNEIKETEEIWKCDCESDSLTGPWEKLLTTVRILATQPQDVPICECSGI